jgi:hypothetical protein
LAFYNYQSFSQNSTKTTPKTTPKATAAFINIENNFKWNNFSFRNPYSTYAIDIEEINPINSQCDISLVKQLWPFEDSILLDLKFRDTKYDDYIFDEAHVISSLDIFRQYNSNSRYNTYLSFIKNFDDSIDADKFESELLDYYNNKFGQFGVKKGFLSRTWYGNKIHILIKRVEAIVILSIRDIDDRYDHSYLSSFLFKYDYYHTSDLFKSIDKDNSYRGIRFGTYLNSIKSIGIPMVKTWSKYQYKLESSKYRSWNSINFDNVYLNLTSDLKFAGVYLMNPLDKFGELVNENRIVEYQKIVEKIKTLLGYPTRWVDGLYVWQGKNITICLTDFDNNNTDEDEFELIIMSNIYKIQQEKEY